MRASSTNCLSCFSTCVSTSVLKEWQIPDNCFKVVANWMAINCFQSNIEQYQPKQWLVTNGWWGKKEVFLLEVRGGENKDEEASHIVTIDFSHRAILDLCETRTKLSHNDNLNIILVRRNTTASMIYAVCTNLKRERINVRILEKGKRKLMRISWYAKKWRLC